MIGEIECENMLLRVGDEQHLAQRRIQMAQK
jgi:hypothetical protein